MSPGQVLLFCCQSPWSQQSLKHGINPRSKGYIRLVARTRLALGDGVSHVALGAQAGSKLIHILSVSNDEVIFRRTFGPGKGRVIFVGRLVASGDEGVMLHRSRLPYAASLAVGAFVGLTFGEGSYLVAWDGTVFFAFSVPPKATSDHHLQAYRSELLRLLQAFDRCYRQAVVVNKS